MTAGSVPVPVRDPLTIVRGAASVEATIGRPVGVALGTSSIRVVEGVHGRSRAHPVGDLRDNSAAAYVAHRRGEWFGATDAHGFRRRLPPPPARHRPAHDSPSQARWSRSRSPRADGPLASSLTTPPPRLGGAARGRPVPMVRSQARSRLPLPGSMEPLAVAPCRWSVHKLAHESRRSATGPSGSRRGMPIGCCWTSSPSTTGPRAARQAPRRE
ncbi:hypothetical protein [Actinophytocola sp.]|uniref:hypothetical protein n=1 Tax=Actinophytocola sp. TaxID=1872138 RepID=UPI003D6C34C7